MLLFIRERRDEFVAQAFPRGDQVSKRNIIDRHSLKLIFVCWLHVEIA